LVLTAPYISNDVRCVQFTVIVGKTQTTNQYLAALCRAKSFSFTEGNGIQFP